MHHKLDAGQARAGATGKHQPSGPSSGVPGPLPSGVPRTPDEAAAAALAVMGKDTAVTTSGTASVAGRSAYELVLTPKDKTTLVGSVRIAIDSQEHVPLRVQVYSTKRTNPAFEVGFTAVDFAKPDARQFAFTPPAGTTVTQSDAATAPRRAAPAPTTDPDTPSAGASAKASAVHRGSSASGWSTVVVAPFTLPTSVTSQKGAGGSAADSAAQLSGMLKALPTTSGAWGAGTSSRAPCSRSS